MFGVVFFGINEMTNFPSANWNSTIGFCIHSLVAKRTVLFESELDFENLKNWNVRWNQKTREFPSEWYAEFTEHAQCEVPDRRLCLRQIVLSSFFCRRRTSVSTHFRSPSFRSVVVQVDCMRTSLFVMFNEGYKNCKRHNCLKMIALYIWKKYPYLQLP